VRAPATVRPVSQPVSVCCKAEPTTPIAAFGESLLIERTRFSIFPERNHKTAIVYLKHLFINTLEKPTNFSPLTNIGLTESDWV
jgi:hypothetical protein